MAAPIVLHILYILTLFFLAVTDSVSSINSAVSFKINEVFPAVTPSPAAAGGEKPKSSSSKKRKFPGPAGVLPKLVILQATI